MTGFYDFYLRPEPVLIQALAEKFPNLSVGVIHDESGGGDALAVRCNGFTSENKVRTYSVSVVQYNKRGTTFEESVAMSEDVAHALHEIAINGRNHFKGLSDVNIMDFSGPTGQIGQHTTFNLLVGASRTEKLGA